MYHVTFQLDVQSCWVAMYVEELLRGLKKLLEGEIGVEYVNLMSIKSSEGED